MKLYTIEKKNTALSFGLMETGSILIKEKLERFPKHHTGCLKCFGV
jgi:hypothetical protein